MLKCPYCKCEFCSEDDLNKHLNVFGRLAHQGRVNWLHSSMYYPEETVEKVETVSKPVGYVGFCRKTEGEKYALRNTLDVMVMCPKCKHFAKD